ncbi:MAG: retropepsin-like aspartic protease [Anaerolineales bacterium]|jgi:predicted aspartyl protease
MQFVLKDNLPFIPVTVAYQGETITIPDVLIDTGSATTILSADMVRRIHIIPSPEDVLYRIRGVGGGEVVFSRSVDFLQVGEKQLTAFEIEVGGMDYGFDIRGILGMDFLMQAGAILDLQAMTIEFS